MSKYTKTFAWIAVLVMSIFAISCATLTLSQKSIKTVSLIGLSWHGKPCTMIQVPAELPLEFIQNADGLIIEYSRRSNFCMIVFAGKKSRWVITVFATNECPAFMALDFYDMKTEKGKSWVWNPKGEIREVDNDQWKVFMDALTPKLAKQYCSAPIKKLSI